MIENYLLEVDNWVDLMKVMDIEDRYCILEHLGMSIICENNLQHGIWNIKIVDSEESNGFDIQDINMANTYLKNVNIELELKECKEINISFNGKYDFIPTKDLADFSNKTYKTLNYARMIGISIVEYIYKRRYGAEYRNFEMISGKFI